MVVERTNVGSSRDVQDIKQSYSTRKGFNLGIYGWFQRYVIYTGKRAMKTWIEQHALHILYVESEFWKYN